MFQRIGDTSCLMLNFLFALYCGLHALSETQSNMSYCKLGHFGTVFRSDVSSVSRLEEKQ